MLNKTEEILAEAVDTMLRHEPMLGLSIHKDTEETSHFTQFAHERINEMFELETIKATHHDTLCAAFNKVHSYKYVDDPKFKDAMIRELSWHNVPEGEKALAEAACSSVVKKIAKEHGAKSSDTQDITTKNSEGYGINTPGRNTVESSTGWNPKLDEIKKASQPEQPGI